MAELIHTVSDILAFVQQVWATPLMEVLHYSVVMWWNNVWGGHKYQLTYSGPILE